MALGSLVQLDEIRMRVLVLLGKIRKFFSTSRSQWSKQNQSRITPHQSRRPTCPARCSLLPGRRRNQQMCQPLLFPSLAPLRFLSSFDVGAAATPRRRRRRLHSTEHLEREPASIAANEAPLMALSLRDLQLVFIYFTQEGHDAYYVLEVFD